MTNGINFYAKVDYILEFLNKRSSVCVWDVCPLAARGWQAMSACLSFPGVSWSKTCNGSDRASCMQQQWVDRLAAVFSVISKSCNFVTLGQITE